MSWLEDLVPTGDMDKMARLIVVALLGTGLVLIGMTYHAEYPRSMIELSGQPWWRAILITAVLASAYWCPRISVLAGFALVLYLADVRALTQL